MIKCLKIKTNKKYLPAAHNRAVGSSITFVEMTTPIIDINHYKYELPADRIALHPLTERDQSNLLVYRDGNIEHARFRQLANHLPENSILFFNNTKVIPARLHFVKDTGALIEIFLLHPISPSPIVALAMEATAKSQWQVVIGNAKRWNGQTLIRQAGDTQLRVSLVDREKSIVSFIWEPREKTFAEVISSLGVTPLPPYLKREVEASDRERYQTIYSKHDGAVAAPTAGLHFTDRVFKNLNEKQIQTDFVTLHVSAGTFQPVKVENAWEHVMHEEQIHITKANVANLLQSNRQVVAVGTTSLRTLESLYWYGVKLETNPSAEFVIGQRDPYLDSKTVPREIAFENVWKKMERDGVDAIQGETSIYLVPGYQFQTADALITNFHQPGSTLMLLIAAFIGDDWRKVYQQALDNNYRFLSYGDSSLLYRSNQTSK